MNNKELINLLKEERNELDLLGHNVKDTNRRLRNQINALSKDIERMSAPVRKRFAPRLRRQIKISEENINKNNYYILTTGSNRDYEGNSKCSANGICGFKLTQLIEEERGGGRIIY